jgi:hypothetical protein
MVHGKTWSEEVEYQYAGSEEEDFEPLDPGWLRTWWDDKKVQRALEDADQVMTAILESAGLDPCSIDLMGDGAFAQQ